MPARRDAALHRAIAAVAPGQPLREGLDRILLAGKGALIVVGDSAEVLGICSGGFLLDAAFSPQRLSELSKMDGAVILAHDASRIARANVHLVPDPDLPTSETGTRHRTAERVARALDVPVISVSERMALISLFVGDQKHPLEPTPRLLSRADQALQALERYRVRLDTVTGSLSALEVEDNVTVRDVASALQRAEMVVRIASEIESYVEELGVDGRMVRLQLVELLGGVVDERTHIIRDYLPRDASWEVDDALAVLGGLETDQLLDLGMVGSVLHLVDGYDDLDVHLQPRGVRILSRIPRLPDSVIDHLTDRFGSLSKLLRASVADLDAVEGVGAARARAIKDGLARRAETSILGRYR